MISVSPHGIGRLFDNKTNHKIDRCWALFHSAIGGCKRQIYHLPNVSSFLPRRALREQLVYRLIAIAVGCSLSGSTNGFQSFKSSFSPLMMPHHDGHHTHNVSPFLIITTKPCIVKYRFPGLLPNRGSASMSSISRRTRKDQLWYKFHSNIFSKVIFSWFYLWGVWGSDLIFSGSVMTSREIGRKSSVATVRWIYSLDASF